MKSLEQLDEEYYAAERRGVYIKGESLEEIEASMKAAFPDAKMGRKRAVSNTGEPYVEISQYAICRDAEFDIAATKKFVASRMVRALREYFESRGGVGTLYYRVPLEDIMQDYPVVIKYDENGPDKDFLTDRRCYLDRGWKGYGMYVRLLLSTLPDLTIGEGEGREA